jgi:phosphate transport system substrate-binding protein
MKHTLRISTTFALVAIAMLAMVSGTHAQDITGAGSTFINPIMTKWAYDYKNSTGTSINYQSVGSGAGINNLIDGTIDFAGSDAPMNADEKGRAKGPVIHLPAVIGAVAVAYNVNGIGTGLGFGGPELADIFLGKIKYWDDPRIVARNPGKKLPHEVITIVHRSDGSGTTAIFTDYLSKVSADWKSQVGAGKTVNWPSGIGGKGSAGVAGVLKEKDNSIGYVEFAYAQENKIPYAAIDNGSGKYTYPSAETAMEAANSTEIPADMCTMITNAPKGYPISGFSWLIVYQKSQKPAELKKFLKYVLQKGQSDTAPLWYAAVPNDVISREMKLIDSIQ